MTGLCSTLSRGFLTLLVLLAQGALVPAFSEVTPLPPAQSPREVRGVDDPAPPMRPDGDPFQNGRPPDPTPGESLGPHPAPEDVPDTEWILFSSKGRVFQPLLADPMEAIFRLSLFYEGRDRRWDAGVAFGGDIGLFYARLPANRNLSLTVRGLVSSRFDMFSESFDLLNIDYLGGLALGYARPPTSLEFLFFHQSSHLGDEILDRGTGSRIDYGKEVARLLWARQWRDGRVYAGLAFTLHAFPADIQHTLTLQAGGEYALQIWKLPTFVALDVQSRQEQDWALNVSAKWGVYLGNPRKVSNRQWVFLSFFNGFSNMGQFYNVRETCAVMGVGYRFR